MNFPRLDPRTAGPCALRDAWHEAISSPGGRGGAGPAGRCRGRLHQQRPQPQPAPRPAELPGGLDGRVGVHRGAGHRGLPRRRRDGRRDWWGCCAWCRPRSGAAAVALADRGRRERVLVLVSAAARRRDGAPPPWWAWAVRRPRLRAGGAVDDRRHALPPGALGAAAVAVPHRARAGQRQRGPRAARLRRHAGGSAGRRGAARGRRRDVVFAVAAAASLWAAGLLLRLRYDAPPRPSAPIGRSLVREAVEGIRVVARNRDLSL